MVSTDLYQRCHNAIKPSSGGRIRLKVEPLIHVTNVSYAKRNNE